jgi:hypothetical protein
MLMRIGAVINFIAGLVMLGLAVGLPLAMGTSDLAWTIGVVVGLGVGGLACLVVGVVLWIFGGRARAAARLLQTGRPATAVIRAVRETGISMHSGMYIILDFHLEVGFGTETPYQVACRSTVPRISLGMVGIGKIVAVRVDPTNPNNVAIDWTVAPS